MRYTGGILYHRENYYQEAFDLCRQMSQIVANQEHAEQKKLYGLRFGITKERLQMYIKLRNTAQAQLQLNMLDNLAEESGNPELTEELLYTKTDYFYIFEQKKKQTQHSTSSSANTGRKRNTAKSTNAIKI